MELKNMAGLLLNLIYNANLQVIIFLNGSDT